MAGRGRGATLPAWMTKGPAQAPPPPPPPPPAMAVPAAEGGSAPGQFSDAQPSASDGGHGTSGGSRDQDRHGNRHRSRSNSRDRDRRRTRDRSRSRSRSRSRDRDDRRRGRRDGSSDRYGGRRGGSDRDRGRDDRNGGRRKGPSPVPEYDWKSRSTTGATSNFDVAPVPGSEPPSISVIGGATASFNRGENGDSSSDPRRRRPDSSSSTRHARRVYVGNIPKGAINSEVEDFLNKVIIDGLGADSTELPSKGSPVVSMSIIPDKQFGFCELASVQLGFAAVNCLDGVLFSSPTSGGRPQNLKFSWTNDFDERKAGNVGPIPTIVLPAELQRGGGGGGGYGGGQGGTSGGGGSRSDSSKVGPDGVRRGPVPEGPGKMFIGGLPYNLGEDEVLQVLKSFGQVSHFHLVVDRESGLSKGYAFASYQDDSLLTATNAAVTNLNGIQLGEKSMTVKIANSQGAAGPAPSSYPQQQQQQQQQQQYQQPPAQAPYGSHAPPATAYGGTHQQAAYGAPPAQPGGAGMYGAPPPQPSYSVPPAQAQYGAYGAYGAPALPQPGAAGGYGAPYAAPHPATASYGAGASTAMYGAPPAAAAATGASAYGGYGARAPPPVGGAATGSRVLKMSNMVTSDEIQNDAEFADILEDVRLECSDHGAVIKVLIPRRKEHYPAHTEGNIFVEFSNVSGASAAKRALTGRKFDNRTVVVEDFDENAYRQGAL